MVRVYQSPLGNAPRNDRRGDYRINQFGEIVYYPQSRPRKKKSFLKQPLQIQCRIVCNKLFIVFLLTFLYGVLAVWALNFAMQFDEVKSTILILFEITEKFKL
jgi:hypothetical protein